MTGKHQQPFASIAGQITSWIFRKIKYLMMTQKKVEESAELFENVLKRSLPGEHRRHILLMLNNCSYGGKNDQPEFQPSS